MADAGAIYWYSGDTKSGRMLYMSSAVKAQCILQGGLINFRYCFHSLNAFYGTCVVWAKVGVGLLDWNHILWLCP